MTTIYVKYDCSICGERKEARASAPVALTDGTFACSECDAAAPVIALDPAAVARLRELAQAAENARRSQSAISQALRDLTAALTAYLDGQKRGTWMPVQTALVEAQVLLAGEQGQ